MKNDILRSAITSIKKKDEEKPVPKMIHRMVIPCCIVHKYNLLDPHI